MFRQKRYITTFEMIKRNYFKAIIYAIFLILFLIFIFIDTIVAINIIEVISIIFGYKIIHKVLKCDDNNLKDKLIFLGIGYCIITIFNITHLFSYYESFISNEQIKPILYLLNDINITFQSIIILIFITSINKKINIKSNLLTLIAFSSLILLISYFNSISSNYINSNNQILFKILYKYTSISILIMTITSLIQKQEFMSKETTRLLFLSTILYNLSRFNYSHYTGDINSIFLIISHIFKFSSYLFMYKAIVKLIGENREIQYKLTKERLVNKTIETSLNAILITNIEGKIIYVNNSFFNLWDFDNINEVVGKNVMELWEDREFSDKRRQEILIDGSWNGEVIAKRKDGSTFEVEVYPSIIKDEQDNPVYITGSIIDISERKKYERKIIENNTVLKGILESTADGIIVVDKNDNVIRYNEIFAKMWNIPEKILKTKDNKKYIHYVSNYLENPQQFITEIGEYIKNSNEEHYKIKLKHGKIFKAIYKPLIIDDEKIGFVWNFTDITNLENMITDLKIRNDIIETSLTPMAYTDIEGKIISGNKSFLNLWGYDLNEVKGMDSLLLWDNEEQAKDKRNQILREGKWFGDITGKRKDNSTFEAQVFINIIKNEEGIPLYRGASIVDISWRKKSEMEIRKSRELYEKLIKLSPNGIFVIKEEKIILANEQLLELFKCKDVEELNNVCFGNKIRIHPDYEKSVKNRKNKLMNEDSTLDFMEQKMILKDGSTINIESAASSFIHQNERYVIVVMKDITEKKLAEDLHKKVLIKDKLLEAAHEYDTLKTQFFSNISHELKTPLNIIFASVQLINKIHGDHVNCDYYDSVIRYSDIMKQNCYRLLRLINNLIDITRFDSGYFNMHMGNYNIVNIVENIALSVVQFAKSKDIDIIFDTDIEEKIIACDPEKIERIILNIISNSIKFTKPNGKIYVDISDKNQKIQISLKDTGIGIPKDKIGNIFERFTQVDSSLSRENEGSGIGLSLVKALVESHGGNITINSELEKGTELIIELPSVTIDKNDIVSDISENMKEKTIEKINIEFSDIYNINVS